MDKVYVMTKAKIFGPEIYVGVKKSFKEAEKALRKMSPYMRKTESMRSLKKGIASYFTDRTNMMLFFIHEEEI